MEENEEVLAVINYVKSLNQILGTARNDVSKLPLSPEGKKVLTLAVQRQGAIFLHNIMTMGIMATNLVSVETLQLKEEDLSKIDKEFIKLFGKYI